MPLASVEVPVIVVEPVEIGIGGSILHEMTGATARSFVTGIVTSFGK